LKLETGNSKKVVAAIPCYNTERSIADVVAKTKKYVDEVIVIDDGSKDKTARVAKAAGAIVISHKTNKGYGGAIKSCFAAALAHGADVLVIIDGDGQLNPHEIPALLAPILNQEADLVIGSRFLHAPVILKASKGEAEGSQGGVDSPSSSPPSPTTHNSSLKTHNSSIPENHDSKLITQNSPMPRYRKFGIGVITSLWNFGSKVKVSDSQSGFRAYNKKLIKDMLVSENGMSSSIEILEKIRKKNPRIKEMPITCSYENNNSHLNTKAALHGLGVAFSVIRIRIKYALKKEK